MKKSGKDIKIIMTIVIIIIIIITTKMMITIIMILINHITFGMVNRDSSSRMVRGAIHIAILTIPIAIHVMKFERQSQ